MQGIAGTSSTQTNLSKCTSQWIPKRKAGSEFLDGLRLAELEGNKLDQDSAEPQLSVPIGIKVSKIELSLESSLKEMISPQMVSEKPLINTPTRPNLKVIQTRRSDSRSCELSHHSPPGLQNTSRFRVAAKRRLLDDYKIGKEIGRGGYSTVHSAIFRQTGESRAIKIIKKNDPNIHSKIDFGMELYILKQMNHPNIIQVYEVIESQEFVYIVLEHCFGGDLGNYLREKGKLNQEENRLMIRQIAEAVSYMHRFGLCHGDLKPENIMLKHPNDLSNIKLIDFGFSQRLETGQFLRDPIGTSTFCAPEIIMQKFDMRIDNWCMGLILYLCLTGNLPFKGANKREIIHNTLTHEIDIYNLEFACLPFGAKELVLKLLTKDPDRRLPAEIAKKHPWVLGYIDDEFKQMFIEEVLYQSQRLPLICRLNQLIILIAESWDTSESYTDCVKSSNQQPKSFSHTQPNTSYVPYELDHLRGMVARSLQNAPTSVLAFKSGITTSKKKKTNSLDSRLMSISRISPIAAYVIKNLLEHLVQEQSEVDKSASQRQVSLVEVSKYFREQFSSIYEMIPSGLDEHKGRQIMMFSLESTPDPDFLYFLSLLVGKICRYIIMSNRDQDATYRKYSFKT